MKRYRDTIASILLLLADWVYLNVLAVGAIVLQHGIALSPRSLSRSSLLGFLGFTCLVLLPSLGWVGAYRMPRRWKVNEVQPVMTKAMLLNLFLTVGLILAVRANATIRDVVVMPSGGVMILAWIGLWAGLSGNRLIAGRLQLILYRHGIGLRRAVIVGNGPEALQVAERLKQNPWLGERLLGYVSDQVHPSRLGAPGELQQLVQRHQVDVVWLAPSSDAQGESYLPADLVEAVGDQVIWRVLPEHADRLSTNGFSDTLCRQRGIYRRRRQHPLALPTFRVVMLGSRGAPANYGGVEKYVEEVGAHLVERGAQVTVYCHSRYVPTQNSHRGMQLRFVPAIRTKHLETISHTLLATLHALLREDDIFHYHALGPATLAWLPRLCGRQVVVTIQGLDWQRAKWGLLARLYLKFGEWSAIHVPHRSIVVSQAMAGYYQRRYQKRLIHIPNGFDLPVPRSPYLIKEFGLEKENYLLFVGRLVPEKGCHTLLRALARVHTDKQLVIAGQATYEDAYRQQLDDLACSLPNVRFVGFVQGEMLQELYTNPYVVVHPSEMEGLSISLLEALSHGNCLLVSDASENLEAVGELAYSFKTGDYEDLARQLQRLLDHPDLVKAARIRAQSFMSGALAWRAVSKETENIYTTLVGLCRSGGNEREWR